MKLRGWCLVGALTVLAGAGAAAAGRARCASPDDVAVLGVAALQQTLMDAALTCGAGARTDYNTFQVVFGPALVRTDRQMLALFVRLQGRSGAAGHNAFKTDLASSAELRRIRDPIGFCAQAADMARGALVSGRAKTGETGRMAALKDFAVGVVDIGADWPVPCLAIPDVVPQPNPLRLADGAP